MVPPVVEAPRGARWAAAIAVGIGRAIGGFRGSAAPARAVRERSASPRAIERLGANGAS
jgi:hypothetical protein